jgi:hypothetical protein
MTAHYAKAGRLFGAIMPVLLFAASAANAWGADSCVPFKGTSMGSFFPWTPALPDGGWVSDVYFTIGGVVLPGTIVYSADDVVPKKTTTNPTNTFLGYEKGTVTLIGITGTFDLVSHFSAPQQTAASGVSMLNESGTLGNGTGVFAGISGHFTDHGIYGPSVPHKEGAIMGVTTTLEGTICGVDLSALGLAAKTK